jgi:hypothetical protein
MSRNPRIFIYTEHPSPSLRTDLIADYLESFGLSAEIRGDFLTYLSLSNEKTELLAEHLASMRVEDIEKPLDDLHFTDGGLTSIEVQTLKGNISRRDVLYDGLWVQRAFHKLIADKLQDEMGDGFLHIIFTGRLFGTFESNRYHARVVLAGEPSLISTSGLVEAPAKPREYYFIKGGLRSSGRDATELDKMYKGRFVEYDDPKISDILRSYALQTVNYKLTGAAFCEDPTCCLYNSHWQEEVLKVQHKARPCRSCFENIKKCIDG